MKLYIAGPMRNLPKFNFPAFFEAAAYLKDRGHSTFNPAARDIDKHGEGVCSSPTGNLKTAEKKGFNLREALAADTKWICLHAEGIVLLPGWETSKGACAERALGEALGLPIFLYPSVLPVKP